MEKSEIYLVYVIKMGKDPVGDNFYKLFFSENPEDVYSEGWAEKPACNQSPEQLMIDSSMYSYTAELRCDIELDLAQDNCCFTMQDCKDGIVAVASENLDNAEEYPEQGRVVLHFGDSFSDVEEVAHTRGFKLRINKN